MAKFAIDAFLDAYLDYIADATLLCICSAQPATYTEAHVDYMLAEVVVDSGDFAKADDTSGRKLTVAQQVAMTVTNSGTATHIAICKTAGTLLKAITTCDSQALVAAGSVTCPAFKVNIQDPT
jgi:hypothetical protein